MRIQNILLVITLLASALFFDGCSRNPVTGKKEFVLMSENQEISMGKESDPQIVAAYGLYENAAIQSFITKKGKAMAAISHRPHLNYEFKVLDSPVVNAFAVPGGYIYFTRGILAYFNNEAEFAGVLGHEIGHVTARHSVQQYSKQMLGQVLFIGGLIVSEDFRNFADVAQQGLGLLFLKFSRDHESQSDELGVEYSTKIGYDAHEMADFFQTLNQLSQNSGAGSIPDFLSTHPNPADRQRKVDQMATEIQKSMPNTQLAVNEDSYLKMIDGLVYGEDPRQGYVENSRFYHPELKFQFPVPQSWKVANSPSQVQIVPNDGKALIVFGLENANSLDQAASNVIKNNQLTVVDRANINVNGNQAIALISDQIPQSSNAQQTNPLRILTYLIKMDNYIYKFHGLSLKTDFDKYYNTFQNTMRNFDRLSDPSKLNRQPTVLRVKPVKSSGTIEAALKSYGMPQGRVSELVLLNGMSANAQVKAGRLIKVLENY